MKSAVTVSLVPEARGGPFVFWDDLMVACREAKRLGFDAIEVFAPDSLILRNDEFRELIDDNGLSLAAAGTGAGWVKHKLSLTHPDPTVREKAKAFVRSIIGAAGAYDAPAIIGSMQGRWGDGLTRDEALGWLGEALAELGDHAAQYDVPLIYEPLNRYETNLIHTLSDGVEFITGFGLTNVKLLADLFHMNVEEVDIPAAIRSAGSFIGHVHFADSNRRAVGGGHTAMPPIIAALREVGYAGYLSAEVFPLPDYLTAATTTIQSFRKHVG
jgi:sugar phosphate isomerase/epimerase